MDDFYRKIRESVNSENNETPEKRHERLRIERDAKLQEKNKKYWEKVTIANEKLCENILYNFKEKVEDSVQKSFSYVRLFTYNPGSTTSPPESFKINFLLGGSREKQLEIFKENGVVPLMELLSTKVAPFKIFKKWNGNRQSNGTGFTEICAELQ